MAYAAGENKEMEHGMHVTALVETIEHGSGHIHHSLGYDPRHSGGTHAIEQRLERHKYLQPHAHETERLKMAVLLESHKTNYRSGNGTQPHK